MLNRKSCSFIASNLSKVRESISETALSYGRNPREISLLAISKTYSLDSIQSAFEVGQVIFGESRVQETAKKFIENGTVNTLRSKIKVSFIGTLQKNKISNALKCYDCIQSIDSIALVQALINTINNEQKGVMHKKKVEKYPVYLQVRCSDYDYKHGFDNFSILKQAVETVMGTSALILQGIMTIAPFSDNESVVRNAFYTAYKWKGKIEEEFNLKKLELSMGMSGDYRWAIAEGSTMVRIGRSIFGERIYA